MWGITNRRARPGPIRRAGRAFEAGSARVLVRGPAEHGVLELGGEIDFSCADAVLDIVSALPDRIVAIDAGGLEFVDVEGAIALMRMQDILSERHDEVVPIVAVPRAIQRAVDLVSRRPARSLVLH